MKIEKRLAVKSLKEDKNRSVISVIAIALTTILFTVLLTMISSILNTQKEENMRLSGSQSFATIKYISDEEYEILKHVYGKENVGYRIFVSSEIDNKALVNKSIEVSYMDENYMKTHFCSPSIGSVPKEINEILCDSKTLTDLGIEPDIGNKVKLELVIRKQKYVFDFYIAGIIPEDSYSKQTIIVSKAFADYYESELENTYAEDGELSGVRMMDVKIDNKLSAKKYFEKTLHQNGYSLDNLDENFLNVNINPAYESHMTVDFMTILGGLCTVFVFMLTGYLIIYNIFEISITKDIHFWGMLRMIGTEKKSIFKIVRYQAFAVMTVGIPIGIIFGIMIGRLLFPYVAKTTTIGADYYKYDIDMWAIAFAVLFVMITVYCSVRKSAKAAISVSPVAAIKCTDGEMNIRIKQRKVKKGSIRKIAAANVGRNKKRVVLVVISLGISLILFDCTFILANGIDREKYLHSKMKSDFVIGNSNYFNVNKHFRTSADELDENIIEEISKQEGFTQGGVLYAYTPIGDSLFEYPEENKISTDEEGNQYAVTSTGARYLLENGALSCQLYGADDYIISNFDITEGITDAEDLISKMNSGKYIIMSESAAGDFLIGDTVTLVLDDKEYQYTLLAKIHPGRTEYCKFTTTGFSFYLSSNELKKIDNATIMNYSFDAERIDEMEKFISDSCDREWLNTGYISADTYYTSYNNLKMEFWVMGIFMSVITGGVGIINFINVILTSILSRKKEIAIMQGIGMEDRQLRKMLCTEGVYYSIFALAGSIAIGSFLIPLVSKVLEGMMEFYAGYITIKPMLLIWLLYFAISIIVPLCGQYLISKNSVIARIRQE